MIYVGLLDYLLVLNEKRKNNNIYAAGLLKTAAYSLALYAAVLGRPAAYG